MSGTIKDTATDDDIFDGADFTNDEDEKVKAEILKQFDDGSDNQDDESWMSPDIGEETPLDVTSQTDGQKAIERAEDESRKARRTEDLDDPEDSDKGKADDDAAAKESDKTKTGEDAKGEDTAKSADADDDGKGKDGEGDDADAALRSATVDTLLDGMPDDRKSEVSRRLKASEAALAPFQTPYAKEQMQRYGVEPSQMASRLVELATFAEQKPDEYLAWAASEMAATPDKIGEVLASAAKLHGYKLVKDGDDDEDDDDDLFLDDRTKAILEENRRLKAAQSGEAPTFGPDTPERQQARTLQQQLHSFVNETDDLGQPKRPHFQQLSARITEMAAHHRNTTGKNVTTDDLAVFYDQAAEEARRAFGVPAGADEPSAAQRQANMSDEIKKKAAAAEKARRASKSIGGAGQGANRQPAQSGDDERTVDVVERLARDMGIDS